MIGRLNHVAIAVPDLAAATQVYRDTLGARVSEAVDQPEHGVTTVFIELPTPRSSCSACSARARRSPASWSGTPMAEFIISATRSRHHRARDRLVAQGARVLGQGEPKIGAHGKPVLFLHPKDFCGTLVELEEA